VSVLDDLDPRTPVIAGVGIATQSVDEPGGGDDAAALMTAAAVRAAAAPMPSATRRPGSG